jgi:hypothetical protein
MATTKHTYQMSCCGSDATITCYNNKDRAEVAEKAATKAAETCPNCQAKEIATTLGCELPEITGTDEKALIETGEASRLELLAALISGDESFRWALTATDWLEFSNGSMALAEKKQQDAIPNSDDYADRAW